MQRDTPATTRLLLLGAAFGCALLLSVVCFAAEPAKESSGRPDIAYDSDLRVLHHGDTERMQVCITIDDGPNPETTRGLLYILRKKGVKATFFLIGRRAEAYPELVRAIVADGHEIGNHTMNHSRLSGLDPQEIMNEIELGRDAIQSAAEVRVDLFRPPGGSMSDDVYRVAGELGYTNVLWTETANDWYRQDPGKIVDRVLSRAGPGSIIVIHDGKPDILDALPKIIDGLKERGYSFRMAGEWAVRFRYGLDKP